LAFRRAQQLVLLVLTGILLARIAVQIGVSEPFLSLILRNGLDILRAAMGAGACAIAAMLLSANHANRGNAWYWMSGGLAAYALGEVFWFWSDLRGKSPVGSLADPIYLLFYPLFSYGLLRLPHPRRNREERVALVLDLATVLLAGFVLVWSVVLRDRVAVGNLLDPAFLTAAAYPLGDLLLVWSAVYALSVPVGIVSRRVRWLIAAGCVVQFASDLTYAVQVDQGTYDPASWLGNGWTLGIILLGAGATLAWTEPERTERREQGEGVIQLTGIMSALLAFVSLAVAWTAAYATGDLGNDPRVFGSVLLMLAFVGLRLMLGLRMVMRLHEAIHLARERLEERVHARTEELSQANEQLQLEIRERGRGAETFKALTENARDVIARFDLNHRYLYANPVIVQVMGIPRERLIGKDHREIGFSESIAVFFEEALNRTAQQKAPYRTEMVTPNGVCLDWMFVPEFDADRSVCAIISTARDITERNLAEQALKESEAKYRDLVENASSIILRMNADGRITFFNEFAQSYFGYTEREILGRHVIGTIVPPDEESARVMNAILLKMSVRPGEYQAHEGENICKNGERVWVAWTHKPLCDESGRLREILCVGNDITQLRRTEAQLWQAQKMEAVGQLAGGVAHDFNNLLQGILGYGELLLSELQPDDPRFEEVKEIEKAAERASRLTRQLLAFSRRQVLAPKPLNINDVIEDLARMIRRVIGEHINLHVAPAHPLDMVHADCGQIEQVLMNLCVNARDAMAEGGTLTIETRNVLIDEARAAAVDGGGAKPGRYVLISVADSGCGMDEATVERIFEPFFTTKAVGQGTGLGLATVYGIVKQHDGFITVDSRPGAGTTFEVCLPAKETQVESPAAPEHEPLRGGHETILLAEDEEQVRIVAVRYLQDAGYNVISAANGEDALRKFAQHRDAIDLLLLDVVMPRMGGPALLEEVRQQRPDIPCLFASGYSESALHVNFVLRTGLTLIQKPYRRDELLRLVRRMLDRSASGETHPHPGGSPVTS